MFSQIEKLASAIRNDVVGGLRGYHTNMSMSMEQLCDEIIDERAYIIEQYWIKGILPLKDLYLSINCILVDCKDLDRCSVCGSNDEDENSLFALCSKDLVAHFEIPQLMLSIGDKCIHYIGSTDRRLDFDVYTSVKQFNNKKYKKHKSKKPYVYIDTTPNENNMYDCFLFNAPLIQMVSVVGIFKDPRQLEQFSCCTDNSAGMENLSFLNSEIHDSLVQKKLRAYRFLSPNNLPNDQQYTQG